MKFVPNSVSRAVGKQILKGRKNSPTILFATGVVGMVGTTVLASRATLRLDEVLEQAQSDLSKATDLVHPDYSEDDRKKDKAIIYVRSALGVVKLYAPAIVLGTLSIAALAGSHRILNRRNAALVSAYGTMAAAFEEYRKRVTEELGEERERELRYAVQEFEIAEDTPKGVKVVNVKRATSASEASPYARVFGEGNQNWREFDPNGNATFLKAQEQYANSLLHARGFIMLNEVYDMLGLEPTSAGAVVGWVRNNGDNYVSFDIGEWPNTVDYINGTERGCLLDFNVDGVVYDLIDKI